MNKKLKLLLLSNKFTIGGGERKVQIYYEELNKKYFDIYYVFLDEDSNINKKEGKKYILSKENLLNFVKNNNIDFFYSFTSKLSENLIQELTKHTNYINSVNFTPLYKHEKNIVNLIISKTDYLKIKDFHNKKLDNAYVVYNPINTAKWIGLNKKSISHRKYFQNKNIKFIIGRLGRMEPTKWNFLILATLIKLNFHRKYDYGFVFAGMPKLYKWALKLFLTKKFQRNILLLPQLVDYENLGKFYNSIDLFWQTSYIGESFGNVIAESFCFKVPVITDFKDFYTKIDKVNPKWYNAQMELVDYKKNGFYANYPSVFINYIDQLTKKEVNILGTNGFKKTKTLYDVSISVRTMEKLFYEIAYEKKIIDNIPQYYRNIKLMPSIDEVRKFKKEYLAKLSIAKKVNEIKFLEKIIYHILEKIWNGIEYIYVTIRYILKQYFKKNIENK